MCIKFNKTSTTFTNEQTDEQAKKHNIHKWGIQIDYL